jgi:outer membrane scaffolding protein for murein synthesis (MipA/OmpV family)
MCSGGGGGDPNVSGDRKKSRDAANKRIQKKSKEQQRRFDQLARERTALASQQRQRQAELQAQASEIRAAQTARVDRLKREQSQRLKTLKAGNDIERRSIQAETAKKVAGLERAGGAAATSLRILAQEQPVGPNAQQTPRGQKRRGAGVTSANVARGSSAIRGTNLSI